MNSLTPLYLAIVVSSPAAALAQQVAPVTPKAEKVDGLVQAYQKEFAFLQAQKASLEKRLKSIDATYSAKLGKARERVEQVQAKVLRTTLKADAAEDALRDSERNDLQREEWNDRLDAMMSQARATLVEAGRSVPEEGNDTVAPEGFLGAVFPEALALIEERGTLHERPGKFYLADGREVRGTLIHLGRIATYGLSDEGSGALAPAGGGRLKLWHQDAQDATEALAARRYTPSLEMFVHESLTTAVEEKLEKTVFEFVRAGGVIAWVIVGLGFLALAMALARIVILYRASARSTRIMDEVVPMIEEGRIEDALDACSPSRGAIARVLRATIRNLKRDREHLEDIVSEAVLHETPFIERFGTAITVCAAVAPLLGLLGTVTGMISTFDVITEYGTGDPKMLSGGISEALVTTELGLIVAIPALLLGSALSSRGEALLRRMERSALRVMNIGDRVAHEELEALEESTVVTMGKAAG